MSDAGGVRGLRYFNFLDILAQTSKMNAMTLSFSHGVATRVHAPPFYTRYVTRVFKTGAVPSQKMCLRVMYTRIFHWLVCFLFQHGGKMSSIWRPFRYLGDDYLDKVLDMVSV
jgi:hypothetical protein